MNNLNYFKISTKHKEPLIDPNYSIAIDQKIIPDSADKDNLLIRSFNAVIKYIDDIEILISEKHLDVNSKKIVNILKLIIPLLKVAGMNYTPFCQYFNVHNVNYSIFNKMTFNEKIEILKYIIKPYIQKRHRIYKAHGYSNIIMQVMCDNYSHKRKGKYGVNKISNILKNLGFKNLAKSKEDFSNEKIFYLESDKGGKKIYKKIAKMLHIKLSAKGKKTVKYPDAFIRIRNDYFIVEQKNMKEDGGGQDKQTLEITDFIDKKPEFKGLHYVTFMDGVYFNKIDENAKAKTKDQYDDIISTLKIKPFNYFVNSYGFEKLINDYLKRNRCKN